MNENTADRNPNWIRLMADYSSTGLWHKNGPSVETSYLPVSAPLLERLEAWCGWYERNDDYLPEAERKSAFDYQGFAAEGLAIARGIKAELPDWTVIYFDEMAYHLNLGQGVPRETYEYEIQAA